MPNVDWEEAYSKNRAILRSVACRIVGPNNAEDMVQTSFMRAVASNFRGESTLRTWLTRIVINTCLMYKRQSSLKHEELVAEPNHDVHDLGDSAFDKVKKCQLFHKICENIALLPPTQQVTVRLKLADYDFWEISEILGTSYTGVKTNYFRALKNIRKSIGVTS
jgi:RNA polymerase sigma-70 factor, ECF subfamily